MVRRIIERIAVWLVDHFSGGCSYCGLKFRRQRFAEPGACPSGRCGYCGRNYCTAEHAECPHQCPTEWAEGSGA